MAQVKIELKKEEKYGLKEYGYIETELKKVTHACALLKPIADQDVAVLVPNMDKIVPNVHKILDDLSSMKQNISSAFYWEKRLTKMIAYIESHERFKKLEEDEKKAMGMVKFQREELEQVRDESQEALKLIKYVYEKIEKLVGAGRGWQMNDIYPLIRDLKKAYELLVPCKNRLTVLYNGIIVILRFVHQENKYFSGFPNQ